MGTVSYDQPRARSKVKPSPKSRRVIAGEVPFLVSSWKLPAMASRQVSSETSVGSGRVRYGDGHGDNSGNFAGACLPMPVSWSHTTGSGTSKGKITVKNKRKFIGAGPNCPRCHQPSQLYEPTKSKKIKLAAFCTNSTCPTKSFPPNTKVNHSDRVSMGDGPPCPRCHQITTAWKHSDNWAPRPGRSYYLFWYQCKNDACTTQQIMPPEAKIKGSY